jgi:hypothetical protein
VVPGQLEEGVEVWVKGAHADDNQRYKGFLMHMEERREESRERLIEEEERKGIGQKEGRELGTNEGGSELPEREHR